MPDAMDHVQQLNADLTADALKRHAERARLPGLPMCENSECGEPISDIRRGNGARLCLACQHALEGQAAHQRVWRGHK